jgi:hypothetical protein
MYNGVELLDHYWLFSLISVHRVESEQYLQAIAIVKPTRGPTMKLLGQRLKSLV